MAKKILLTLIVTALLGTPWLLSSDHHDMVLAVQVKLADKGFDPGPQDGIMGPRTSQALLQFQRQEGLEPTGRINDETLQALELKEEGLWGKVKGAVGKSAEAVAGAAKTTAKATAKGAKKVANVGKQGGKE